MPDAAPARVIPASELTDFAARLLAAAGVSPERARAAAGHLVEADLRGVDSHGVQLLTFYLEQLIDGRVDPLAEGCVISESGATLLYDGRNGLGQTVASICADHAARLASAHGLGLAVSRDSNHFGAAFCWAERMAAQGHIGIALCNASPVVAPWGGRDPRWGTNPICCALPGGRWLLDMATTTVAMGKIYRAWVNHQPEIPSGWAMNRDGMPTTSTMDAYHGLLAPLGGYKGAGLAMMVEILTGVLSGGAFLTQLGGLRNRERPFAVSQFFFAIEAARFMPLSEFERRMEAFVAEVKSARTAAGADEVLVSGEPEWRTAAHRRAHGIPVPDGLWTSLSSLAARLGVTAPRVSGGSA
jgi:LDH2 family malate/lactate/ureidoglycolate dehydrogenase